MSQAGCSLLIYHRIGEAKNPRPASGYRPRLATSTLSCYTEVWFKTLAAHYLYDPCTWATKDFTVLSSNRENTMRTLKICLWVVGAACLIAGMTLFLPTSIYTSLSQLIVNVEFPEHRLFSYALRVASGTYLLVGVFYIILALDPRGYGIMLPFAGVAPVVIGLTCLVVGILEGISFWVFGGDAVFALLMGGLILYFWRVERAESAESGPQEKSQAESESA